MNKKRMTYRQAGVDIEKAEKALENLKNSIHETHNSRVLKPIGAFGGFYKFPQEDYRQPVLVASTDGVGTKLKVAMMMNRHDTVGMDLVNHCINDIAVCGAQPLFFLDYFACGKLQDEVYRQILSGFINACKAAELPLIGGETAEMPDMYPEGEYDLAGTIVGVVEKDKIIDGREITAGDRIIGAASNGLHTNGYSLARKVLFSHYQPGDYVKEIHNILGDELLKVHLNYYPLIRIFTENYPVKGMAHITGGGLYKNTARVVPTGYRPRFFWGSWNIPAIFQLIQELGNVPEKDMRQSFNLGIGLVFIVEKNVSSELIRAGEKAGHTLLEIGEIEKN
ncbi:MAG: phosphoribosylformylglycinamidine cyclo-ligase [Calditrichia bacterium]